MICLILSLFLSTPDEHLDPFQIGWTYEESGKLDSAVAYYKKTQYLLWDHALQRTAHCISRTGKYLEATIYYEYLLKEFPEFVNARTVLYYLAECYEKLGKYGKAIEIWKNDFEPPYSWYRIAKIYEQRGENADILWLKIATNYPKSAYAQKCLNKIPQDSLLLIGKIKYYGKDYKAAIKHLTVLEEGAEILALSLYKLGNYKKAAPKLRDAELFFFAGECERKLGKQEKALQDYEKATEDKATIISAQILEELGRKEEALAKYDKISKSSKFYDLAALRKGLLAMELEKPKLAIKSFKNTYPSASYYWRYQVFQKENKWDSAATYYEKLIDEYPLSYHAWRLNSCGEILGTKPKTWIRKFVADDWSLLATEEWHLKKGDFLLELGIADIGVAELKAINEKSPFFIWHLTKTFHKHGLDNYAIIYGSKLKFKGGLPQEVAKVLYPQSFLPLIRELSGDVDDLLLLALIREESYFNPKAVSSSNAMGLTQILPSTGKLIAKSFKMKNYDLFDPYTNIKFGAYYLKHCLNVFDGKLEFAIAAYNAGPGRVKKWVAQGDTLKIDAWVEKIPVTQTRRYVRKVLRSYFVYQVLYGQKG